jgi:HAD superfamily hydrolase (TIGR01509 family)
MIKAIIFDWGGVLAPSDHNYAADKLIDKYNFNKDEFLKILGEKEVECSEDSNYQTFLDAIKQFNIPEQELIDTLNETTPNELFTFTKDIKNHTLVILSNQMQFRTDAIKKMYDLSHFKHIFFSSEMGTQKPKTECFTMMLNTINIPAEQCLFIDDRAENIEAAKQLNIQTIYCTDVKETIEEITKITHQ